MPALPNGIFPASIIISSVAGLGCNHNDYRWCRPMFAVPRLYVRRWGSLTRDPCAFLEANMETQRRGDAEMKVPRELACSLGFFGDYVTLLKARAGDPSTQDDASTHE